MQGRWKENVGGYHKDCRRKKHSRKHTLKDKVKPLIKKYIYNDIDTDFIWEDGVIHTQPEPIYKQSGFIETWKINVTRYVRDAYPYDEYHYNVYSNNVRTAYYSDGWYDEYTNEPIIGDVTKLSFLWKVEVQYDTPKKINRKRSYFYSEREEIYVYGKPLPKDWNNIYGFWGTKSRKPAAKMANKIGRAKVREWIHKADWDKPIKNYALEKSIAWEIW